MGIDTWYLQSLQSAVASDAESQAAVQAAIQAVADTLTAPRDNPANNTDSLQATAATPTTVNTLPKSAQASREQPSAKPRPSHTTVLPPAVKLNREINSSPPETTEIVFPSSDCVADNWQALATAITALPEQQGSAFHGQGSQTAKWLLIAPPPTRHSATAGELLDEEETTLLNAILEAINCPKEKVYYTPLVKQANRYNFDPESQVLAQQLPLLATELALLQPEKVLLLGQVAANVVLQTHALLADLMAQPYQLHYQAAGQTRQAELLCIPSLDYFLALPSEKAMLWQCIKQWAV